MKKISSSVVQFRGTHYEFGYHQGTLLKNHILVKNRENQWKVRTSLFSIDIKETKRIFQEIAPAIWEELLGFGDALEWPMERVLLEFGGYRVNLNRSGCSIITGADYMIRNYDYHPKTYDGFYSVFQPTDTGYAVIGVTQKVTGRCDGMNEKGLAMGYTFMHRKRPKDGFVCHMIGRMILETCANIEEAVSLLKQIPHRGSFSYVLFDKDHSESTIVEASPRNVEVRTGASCTNHFQILKKENRHYLKDSKRRLEIMESSSANLLHGKEAFQLLNGTENGVFSKLYGQWAGTIHTTAYFPSKLEAWIALGGDQQPVKFDFASWLKGNDFPVSEVTGMVDTDIPFVHMEKADWYKK
ncbi:Acyl-coenzyme A:6-aminopenicillanic acid acyl-transferase [Oceanobacillus oncorhynchi]|uniref:Acyl-coenzyme A:6-aminopenicillanic acid acyl-transferase n=1 Tax=Oceanobacillus oncorhynchi TaxID=545501 RepID=A0A0A1MUR2_9BACI|nr:C45 family peptidase [Oceanobacillus oncorhynchi]CEI83374.1 Acyl-coenzyme A:6-aminopenicillanic acid acyl-transferase [Oceanobacillus oncorhynchi]